ncbi:MAG: hypothetical protein ACR2L3_05115 [Actinomycetota bacterium]
MADSGFGAWLLHVMPKLGVTDVGELRAVLVAHGCPSSELLITEWIDGTTEPSFDKMRAVLSALNSALGDTDVWDAYDRFARGGDASVDASPLPKADPASLDDMTRDARLPPGLSP